MRSIVNFFFGFLLIVVFCFSTLPVHADDSFEGYGSFTFNSQNASGSFSVDNCQSLSCTPWAVPGGAGTFNAALINYSESQDCYQGSCFNFRFGNLGPGTVSLELYDEHLNLHILSGFITGGRVYDEFCQGICGLGNGSEAFVEVEFKGTWENGWTSSGGFVTGCYVSEGDYYQNGCPSPRPLDLQMVTTTPEPSSVILFGSGVLGLVGLLRRKLLG